MTTKLGKLGVWSFIDDMTAPKPLASPGNWKNGDIRHCGYLRPWAGILFDYQPHGGQYREADFRHGYRQYLCARPDVDERHSPNPLRTGAGPLHPRTGVSHAPLVKDIRGTNTASRSAP